VVEGKSVSVEQIEVLASLPSKDELYSKLLFLLNAPATRLATALAGVGRKMAVVIDQGVKENKFKSDEAASA
jgi:large subunit ribosomal protein L10